MEKEKQNPLGYAPVTKLMLKFAIPSIIGMLVSALYNIDNLYAVAKYPIIENKKHHPAGGAFLRPDRMPIAFPQTGGLFLLTEE